MKNITTRLHLWIQWLVFQRAYGRLQKRINNHHKRSMDLRGEHQSVFI